MYVYVYTYIYMYTHICVFECRCEIHLSYTYKYLWLVHVNCPRVILLIGKLQPKQKNPPFSISEEPSEYFPNILTIGKALFIQTNFNWVWEKALYPSLDTECNWMFVENIKNA